jgi:hypothetical protein
VVSPEERTGENYEEGESSFIISTVIIIRDLNPIENLWVNMKRNLRDTTPLYDLLQTAIYKYLC